MWDKGTLKKMADIELHYRFQMARYDAQPQYIRQLIQEHGFGAIKQAKQQLRTEMVHIPSQVDGPVYTGIDFGREPSYTTYTHIKRRND